jgi:hypothetical protein
LQQGTEVKAGTPGDDRKPASARNGGDGGAPVSRVVSRGVEGIWSNDIEQMMWDLLPLLSGWLGGADFQATIDRYRVTADDLTLELPRKRDGERGFAASGRPQNHNQ